MVPGTPYLTAWANSGKSGRASRERALRRMAIRPARLAGTSGAPGVERLRPRANGQRSGGGERGETDSFVRRIACFGDILNMDGPLLEIGSRSVFDNRCAGARLPAGP